MFILGTWYLYLRVLRLCTGKLCCKRTHQYENVYMEWLLSMDWNVLVVLLIPGTFNVLVGHVECWLEARGQFLKRLELRIDLRVLECSSARKVCECLLSFLIKLWVLQVKNGEGYRTLGKFSLATPDLRRVTCECSQSQMFKKLTPVLFPSLKLRRRVKMKDEEDTFCSLLFSFTKRTAGENCPIV